MMTLGSYGIEARDLVLEGSDYPQIHTIQSYTLVNSFH